ncbi:hypothetical protein D3C73_1354730 [compost metagenome]
MPVQHPANKRRDQECAGFGAGECLGEVEDQRQVALDALTLQFAGRANALPGGGELDEEALTWNARRLVQCDQAPGLGQACLLIEGQPRIDLARYPAGHVLQQVAAQSNDQLVG